MSPAVHSCLTLQRNIEDGFCAGSVRSAFKGSIDSNSYNYFAVRFNQNLCYVCGTNRVIVINKSNGFGWKDSKTRNFLLGLYIPKAPSCESCWFKSRLLHEGSGSQFCINENGLILTRVRCQDRAELFRKARTRQAFGHVARWHSPVFCCQKSLKRVFCGSA